jgi:ribose 5-phosphate isomerase B
MAYFSPLLRTRLFGNRQTDSLPYIRATPIRLVQRGTPWEIAGVRQRLNLVMPRTNRRGFLKETALGLVVGAGLSSSFGLAAASPASAQETPTHPATHPKQVTPMKIILAADPFALNLKNPIVAYLKEKGHEVIDLGATEQKSIPYYESCVTACQALQAGKGDRGILMCGTGMGMAVIANRFQGITAAVVESVFAARMCRSINNANVLCLGSMIWAEWMAKEAVETFLTTNLTDGLPQFADFLKDACKKVEAIVPSKLAR